jgi:hypothetical protein
MLGVETNYKFFRENYGLKNLGYMGICPLKRYRDKCIRVPRWGAMIKIPIINGGDINGKVFDTLGERYDQNAYRS